MVRRSSRQSLNVRGRPSFLAPSSSPIVRKRRTAFLAATSAAFTFFLILLAIVRRNQHLDADVAVTLRMQRRQHLLLTRFMKSVSWLGFRPQSLILPASVVAGTWILGLRRDARFLVAAWGASLLSYSTKRLVSRPRPGGEHINVVRADLRDSSFPSGHVLHYVVFWGFVTFLWSTYVRGKWLRWTPVAWMVSVIGLVGPSRVYLGHHWLTDVLASYSLGTGLLMSLIGLRQRRGNQHD